MANVNLIEKKKVNNDYTFYFIEFEANFFQDKFFIGSNLAINVWHLIQISQVMLNLIKLCK